MNRSMTGYLLVCVAITVLLFRQPAIRESPAGLFLLGLFAGATLGATAAFMIRDLRNQWTGSL